MRDYDRAISVYQSSYNWVTDWSRDREGFWESFWTDTELDFYTELQKTNSCLLSFHWVNHMLKKILELVRCQSHLSLPVTYITQNIFLTSSMNFCGFLNNSDPKNISRIILKNHKFGCNWSVIFISRNKNLLIVMIGHTLNQKMNWHSETLHLNFLIWY